MPPVAVCWMSIWVTVFLSLLEVVESVGGSGSEVDGAGAVVVAVGVGSSETSWLASWLASLSLSSSTGVVYSEIVRVMVARPMARRRNQPTPCCG